MTNNTIPNVPRYRVEKTGRGFWPYCVRAGDGTREVFVGHQKQCAVVAAELETAFEDGKFVSCIAPSPAGVDGCRCSMSISMLGDGCRYCQPQEYIDRLSEILDEERDHLSAATAIIDGLRGDAERLQMQLAACGVVALANTIDSAGEARQMHPDYMSASCSDVADAVDREIALRTERDQHAQRIGELEGLLREVHDTYRAAIHWEDLRGTMKRIDAALSAGKEGE